MKTYTTIQGDMWDGIAYTEMGSASFTDKLLNANPQYHDIFIFPAGIVLKLPETSDDDVAPMPPWKQVRG